MIIIPCTIGEADTNNRELGTNIVKITTSLLRLEEAKKDETMIKPKNNKDAIPEYRLASPNQKMGYISAHNDWIWLSVKELQNSFAVVPYSVNELFNMELSHKKVRYPTIGTTRRHIKGTM